MTRIARYTLAVVTLLAAGLSTSCSSFSHRLMVNEAYFLQEGAMLAPTGGGCTHVSLPASSTSDPSGPQVGDFNVAEGAVGEAFVVQVYSDHDLLTSRSYGESMLESGQVDQFSVTTHSGAVYTLRYWGGAVEWDPFKAAADLSSCRPRCG